jgi:hypothetical protein
MKAFFIAIMAVAVLIPTAAGANKRHHVPIPKPRVTVEDILSRAQATNPDPFNVNRNQPQASPAPTVQPTPVVVTMPAPTVARANDLRGWLHSALLTFLTGIAGWLGIKLPSTFASGQKMDATKVDDIVGSLLHGTVIKDPDTKAKVDLALLKALQSGLPSKAIQTGLDFIPGASPFVNILEPLAEQAAERVLQKRAGLPTSTSQSDPVGDLSKRVEEIMSLLKNKSATA